MAEQEEQQPLPVPDAPVPGSSRTGRAVALARLLLHECTRLLQLYVSLRVHTLVMPTSYSDGVTHEPFPLFVARF